MKAATTYAARMKAYLDAVRTGARPCSMYERQAIARHDADLRRVGTDGFPYVWDQQEADTACEFLELLPHVKGRWARLRAGQPRETLRLEGWQVFLVSSIFGWRHAKRGTRRFRIACLYIPRKNAKSTLAAGIGLYMAFADGEPGAEVYAGATSETQAWEVFGTARRMVGLLPEMQEALEVRVNANNLMRPSDGSKFATIIGKPGDGASPHCAIVDEYHEHQTSEQFDTMLTGMGARDQPLLLVLSTAGDNLAGPCAADWEDCKRLLAEPTLDDRKFALIYTTDPDDDWTSEVALIKANPNYDISVDGEFLRAQQREALRNARKQATFKTKHLNLWVNAGNAFFNIELWDRLAAPSLKLEDMADRPCVIGVDLASKIDLAAVVLLFMPTEDQPTIDVFARFYVPERQAMARENAHYFQWADAGWLTVTDGDMIDHDRIFADTTQVASAYNVQELAFDPYQSVMLISRLMEAGVNCVEYRQTVVNMSDPMKYLEALIRAGRLRHDGNPVLRWCIANVEARVDAKDNVYPRKAGNDPARKIDGAVALVQAVGRYIALAAAGDEGFDSFLKNPVVAA
jgi:phage terminase large subunit-like protein